MSKKAPAGKYVIGIDLGTTNSAMAFAEVRAGEDRFALAGVQLLPIPQLTNPSEVREEDLLPSFLYLPGSTDFPGGSLALPWDGARGYVVGRLAQKRGVELVAVPTREAIRELRKHPERANAVLHVTC